jgi:hypothetical protein
MSKEPVLSILYIGKVVTVDKDFSVVEAVGLPLGYPSGCVLASGTDGSPIQNEV